MATSSRAGLLNECRVTLNVMEMHDADFEHVTEDRSLLAATVTQIDEADLRQKHHKGQFHQASRDLEQLTSLARDLILRLKNSIRARYGTSAEKLSEFGLNPRRRVSQTRKDDVKKPPETDADPPQTADPGTEATIRK